jgi:hypothetical protein
MKQKFLFIIATLLLTTSLSHGQENNHDHEIMDQHEHMLLNDVSAILEIDMKKCPQDEWQEMIGFDRLSALCNIDDPDLSYQFDLFFNSHIEYTTIRTFRDVEIYANYARDLILLMINVCELLDMHQSPDMLSEHIRFQCPHGNLITINQNTDGSSYSTLRLSRTSRIQPRQ